jgi:hypothetical protein
MSNEFHQRTVWIAVVCLLLGAGNCGLHRPRAGKLQTRSESIDLGVARTARVEIKMGAGTLELAGGAEHLLDATFTYNVEDWRPEVSYHVKGDQGILSVKQPSRRWSGVLDSGLRYDWMLRLNDAVPLDLKVTLGAGRSNLKLAGLALNSLEVDGGVGQTQIDLTGKWLHDVSVRVSGGVGRAKILLPRYVGVRAKAEGGLGALHTHDLKQDGGFYVNDAFGKSPVTVNVDVSGGVGEIDLGLGD